MRSYLMRSYLMRLLKVLGSVLIVFLVAYAQNPNLALLNIPAGEYRMAMASIYLLVGWAAWL